jgi:hypothetical protein
MSTAGIAAFAVIVAVMPGPRAGKALPDASIVGVSGRIIKSNDTPVANGTLRIINRTRQMHNPPFNPEPFTLRLDANGRFAFRAHCNNEYEVQLNAPDTHGSFIRAGVLVVAKGPDVELGNILVQQSAEDQATFDLIGSRNKSPLTVGPSKAAVSAILVGANGKATLIFEDGYTYKPALENDQVDFSSPDISCDRHCVGWVAAVARPDISSSPVHWTLVVYRPGKPVRKFKGDDRGVIEWQISDWQFVEGGQRVAIYQDFVHGPRSQHYELQDVETGRLIDKWDGALTAKAPKWIEGLRN